MKISILILLSLFATNSLDKAESVKVKLELKTFDEIFGEGWWDKGEAEDLKTPAPTNFGQIAHHQIDRQNTQIGQIEPNSTDQNPPLKESDHSGQIEPNSTDQNPPLTECDHSGQIEPNSTDQNPPLTESDHSDYAKNGEEENEIMTDKKRKIIDKFNAIKDEFKQKGQYSDKERNQIEQKIAKHLKVSRSKIYKWKKEFGLSRKSFKNEQKKKFVEKFDQMKAELKRAGFKNSYPNQINKTVAKKLGITDRTIYNWKSELGQTRTNYSDDEKLEIVKKLMQMESAHSGEDKKSCKEIAERLGVNIRTIRTWKKEFGMSSKNPKNERKNLIEKFDQRKAELKRDGFKNSYKGELDKTVAKELGLNFTTIYAWKRELSQTTPQHKHSHNEQKELMKRYYDIKDKNPKFRDEDIAKMLKIGRRTLYSWKKQFKRQQFHQNSVDGHEHSVEENAAANVQEIESSNSWSI